MVTTRDSVMHIPEVRLDKTLDLNKTRLRQLLEQSEVWEAPAASVPQGGRTGCFFPLSL